MSGSRTTLIDFDSDLLAALRAEDPGKGDRELLEDSRSADSASPPPAAPAPASTSPDLALRAPVSARLA
ncbi:hypothetical protein VSS74_01370 [Conexibacter stalactiti]|uniref:Uncharacterized protein n=1 Tax=Conexibacter stalactiti TaxID=1940611 RepID=A0ABU4HI27_9ACTN|nr:hypothetical protein [Conexibacter stalactiti]MDW5592967.1 hypothetical protein [Conexibacter stalactiti]MEC5033608.1 hypothetical protein [Conexibacter stalactiti]